MDRRKLQRVALLAEDQGIGVPQEEAHRIFQRFYRGNARQVQEGEGAGVGLYLAQDKGKSYAEYTAGNCLQAVN